MFFLFGWGFRTGGNQGRVFWTKCGHCNNEGWWRLVAYRLWFTVFFIPIVPYESKAMVLCDVCQHGIELEGENLDRAKNMVRLTEAAIRGEIPPRKYHQLLDQYALVLDS